MTDDGSRIYVAMAVFLRESVAGEDGRRDFLGVKHVAAFARFPAHYTGILQLMLYNDVPSDRLVPIRISVEMPDGTREAASRDMRYKIRGGTLTGDTAQIDVRMPAPGSYIFEIASGDRVLTRVPLRARLIEGPAGA
jgi:hypothetical protein